MAQLAEANTEEFPQAVMKTGINSIFRRTQ